MSTLCLTNGTVYTGITMLPRGTVIVSDGRIADVVSDERFQKRTLPPDATVYDLEGMNVSAGFIDTHIHGLHGVDTSDGRMEAVLEMSRALPNYGVTGFCPTIYPQDEAAFFRCIRAAVKAMGKEKGAKILGLHLEGPFISLEQRGVQKPEYVKPVDMELMQRIDRAARGRIAIMTVAPELKNMRELALSCAQKGILLSAGHSDARYEHMLEGMQAGILHATHFFNAMRRLHHRDPGVVGAILIHSNVSCEIVADGYHVHPAIIKLLMREKPVGNIVLVTDALRPTAQASGTLLANNEEVYLNEGVFRRVSDDVIAGSALTMIRGVKNLCDFGVRLEDALQMASRNPARILDRHREMGALLPGECADVTVFNDRFEVAMTLVNGEVKKMSDGMRPV